MNKGKGKQMKLEHFNTSKCQKKIKFRTYEIIYNMLLYVAEVFDEFY